MVGPRRQHGIGGGLTTAPSVEQERGLNVFVKLRIDELVGDRWRLAGSVVEVGKARGEMMIRNGDAVPDVGPERDPAPAKPADDQVEKKKAPAK